LTLLGARYKEETRNDMVQRLGEKDAQDVNIGPRDGIADALLARMPRQRPRGSASTGSVQSPAGGHRR